MPDITVSADIHAFMQADDNAAARTALGVGRALTVVSPISASATLATNSTGLVNVSGSTNVVLTLPTGENNDHIHRRIVIASGASATVSVSGALEAVSYAATGDAAEVQLRLGKRAAGWEVLERIVYVNTAPDTTAPTVSTLSPADNASNVAIGSNLVVTFSEAIAIGTGNITIKNLTDSSDTTIAIGSGQVTVSGSTLTINPTSNLVAGKNYAIQIAATCIDDLAGNSFAGILNDTTWNFATAAASTSLPATGLLFDLDAEEMSGSDTATITQFTDRSGLANHATTSGSPIAPPRFRTTAGPGGGKAIEFRNGATLLGDIDETTTVVVSSTAALVAGMTVSGTGIASGTTIDSITNGTTLELSAAAEATDTGVTLYFATPPTELLTLADDAPVTDFHLFVRGRGSVDGCFLTNAAASNILCSIFNNGANRFYFLNEGGGQFLSGEAAVNPTTTYSVIEVERSGSTVTVRQNGTALATGTASGTTNVSITAARLGYALTGFIARTALYGAVQAGTPLTNIRTAFGL